MSANSNLPQTAREATLASTTQCQCPAISTALLIRNKRGTSDFKPCACQANDLSERFAFAYYVAMENEQDDHKGSCVSCGFLSKHALYRGENPIPLPRSYEIDRAERMLGRAFEHAPYRVGNNIRTDLACYRKAAELSSEVQAYMESTDVTDLVAARHVITRHRDCSEWYQYTEGLSPQQHLEQLKTEELDAARKKLEEELLAMSQKVQHDSKLIAETSLAIAKSNEQFVGRIRFWVVLLAVLQFIMMGALAAFLSVRSKP